MSLIVLTGISFAFIGYVFTHILLDDLLCRYKQWLMELPWYIGRPLGLCGVCFTGQITLWGVLPLVTWDYPTILMYLGVISINMIIVQIISKHGNQED